ncbi:MAG: hypothetical protein R3B96_14335 [Pirellulaceae bacterium]|nr:hypothetical protein [Planctomycetales bacterium]
MAKKSAEGKVSKSQAIRDYYAANKTAKPKAIAEALVAQGYDLNAQYVSVILSGDRRKAGKVSKRGRKPKAAAAKATKAAPAAPRAKATATDASLAQLMSAKDLVASAGSVAKARAALDAFAKLVGQ